MNEKTDIIQPAEQLPATTASMDGDRMLGALLADPAKLAEIPIETVERMLALHERMQAEAARRIYFDALAEFQDAAPVVEKYAVIPDASGREKYRYAPLEHIVKQVGHVLRDHGFSYHFETEPDQGGVKVVCVSHHRSGHEERASVYMPGVQVPKANAAQNAGAGITYGKRLAFCNAFGIMTAESDPDGVEPGGPPAAMDEEQAANIAALLDEIPVERRAGFWSWVQTFAPSALSPEQLPANRYDEVVRLLEKVRAGS